ncbi:MAG: TIGR01906 family membrane protein [Anaerolinea sp.]|nr:TIGR01906 family membrane protein [Anaerolinea sp.]
MAILSRLAGVAFIVAIPIFLVTANVRFFATETRFYERGFRKYGAEEATGIPLDQLDRAAGEIVKYFEDDAAALRIIVTKDGQEVSLFSTREIDHMRDVKSLMRLVFRLNEFSLAYILSFVAAVYLWAKERPLRSLARQAMLGVGVGFGALIVVGAFAVTGFDAAWTKFHQIAFNNDLWRLDPSRDHLIQMFPEEFWQEATYLVGIFTLAEAVLIVALASTYLVLSRGPAKSKEQRAQSRERQAEG